MDLVLLGPPGSGKGTQGSLMAEQLGIKLLSTGDLFRGILEDEAHPLYPQVQVVKDGRLVSDEVVNLVVKDGIQKPEYKNGIIFDGYPRTIAQAKALDEILLEMGRQVDLVINFEVTREVLFFRILGRLICPVCKQVYHKRQGLTRCSNCGTELVNRSDDNEEIIEKRLQEYQDKTAPLHAYYLSSPAVYITISVDDASLSPAELNNQIFEKIKEKGILLAK